MPQSVLSYENHHSGTLIRINMLGQAQKFFYTRGGTNFTALQVFLRTELANHIRKLPLAVQRLRVAVLKGLVLNAVK